jgi:putative transposase
MPWGLRRYQQCGHLHFVTFSCYRRRQRLDPQTRRMYDRALERARAKYGFRVFGYVVMPEHVHLLVSEPEGGVAGDSDQGNEAIGGAAGGRTFLAGALLRFQRVE